jgi:eukaryotic-like serine/threonine-protein kinase
MAFRRFSRIEDVYHAALGCPPGERVAFLEQACAGDEGLLHEVQSLLGYGTEAALLFEQPVWDAVTRKLAIRRGTRLGPYEVLDLIGSGGMGEVYQARDTRLDRNVALKVLALELATDAEFRARFANEAKAISALNHPHICGLFDIGREHDIDYLVLELLEGEPLAVRLERGPLPLAQLLRFGIEIADALEAAHRKGIVHRDLKPGNVMLTPTGVKLLDFGLAKHTSGTAGQALSMHATVPGAATAQGTIVGTLQYMAPEQLQGLPADARTDIFAFGSILYEMATGRRAFEASTQASLIAKILTSEVPAVSTLDPVAPPALDHVVQGCLAKEPADRWQTAHDVKMQLQWIQQQGAALSGAERRRDRWREWMAWAAAVTATIIAATALLQRRPETITPGPSRTEILLPSRMSLHDWGDGPVMSPDGQTVVFSGVIDGTRRLYVRTLNASVVRSLPGTEEAMGPFWSPDGHTIWFSVGDQIRRVDVNGGAVVTVGEYTGGFLRTATMNRQGVVLFDSWDDGRTGPIRRLGGGGTATAVTRLDKTRNEQSHAAPAFLPDGQHFLYFAAGPHPGLFLASLGSTDEQPVPDIAARAQYASGHLLYVRQRTLMARAWSPEDPQAPGPEFPVADGVVAQRFSVSPGGTVTYRPVESEFKSLVWFDRRGARLGTLGDPAEYRQVRLSPSGARVAAARGDPDSTDLWIADATKGVFSRVTQDPGRESDPTWSPDEEHLAFSRFSGFGKGVFRKDLVTGVEEAVMGATGMTVDDWTADGKLLICKGPSPAVAVPASGAGPAIRLPQDQDVEIDETHVSADGHWVAYNSGESGQWEIYVATFPDFAGKRQVSVAGGVQPHWRRDGRELFYMTLGGQVMSVTIRTRPTLEIETPQPLFTANLLPTLGWPQYSVTPDGQRFLVMESSRQFFTVLQHWLPSPGKMR